MLAGVAVFGGTIFPSQYFQIALGKSPTIAGLMSLPMIFGLLVSSTVAGQLLTKFGRWKAYLVAGAVVMTGGLLLLSTIDARTSVPSLSVYVAVRLLPQTAIARPLETRRRRRDAAAGGMPGHWPAGRRGTRGA